MIIHRFANGDILTRMNNSLIVAFAGIRRVLSTSPHNGGLRDDLKFAFNHCAERSEDSMRGTSYKEHISTLASELGLETGSACGISTGAYAENAAVVSDKYREIEVTAVVTAGVDINGSRVGEPTTWHETETGYLHVPGTVNIMLFFNCALSDGALTRALITCTEAKTAAILELNVPSCYSSGLATGSGTDGAILICEPDSSVKLTEAGTHFKLGELIGRTVIAAVKQALYLETGLNPKRQFNFFRRFGRYGVTEEDLLNLYELSNAFSSEPTSARERLIHLTAGRELITFSILFTHLLDQLHYESMSPEDVIIAAQKLLKSYFSNSDYELSSYTDLTLEHARELLLSTVKAAIIAL
ncbi:MAG: adenosylcobinamide amidohydrolase, partial [Clostridiaceae bacterium]|nr:adenosylcobinamide amidohydrolase [Clostridiaceae bacterium]